MPKKADLTFAVETLGQALADGLEDLATFNGVEVNPYQDKMPLRVRWDAYQMAERRKEFVGISARRGRKLVGYAGYFIRPDSQQVALRADNTALYLDPSERKGWNAMKLLRFATEALRPLGVTYVVQAVKTVNSTDAKRHARMAALMKRAGYVPYESLFILVL
jgi:GNAT superfamily N-acetyltransferase